MTIAEAAAGQELPADREVLDWDLFGTAIRELAQAVADSGFAPDVGRSDTPTLQHSDAPTIPPSDDQGAAEVGRRLGADVFDAAFAAYSRLRGSVDRQLRQRAMLLSELEIARWLLHGTETRSTEIVDDAVRMLSGLVDEVQKDIMNPIGPQTMPVLGVDEVERLLERAERVR